MLKHLQIQNYALIEHLDITPDKGFTTITGETGAGKSILLGALSLILGQRADSGALQDKTKKCIVEATFLIRNYGLKEFFSEAELDYSDESIIRREISPAGTSRAFINDTPVNLNQLKELGNRLIDIHSQHQTLTLNDAGFQLRVVDAFAGNADLINTYKINYKSYKAAQGKLKELLDADAQAKKDRDYIQFQFNELESAGLDGLNQEELEKELDTLNNAEEIKTNFSKSVAVISEGENTVLQQLAEIKNLVQPFVYTNDRIKDVFERINSSLIELKDLNSELESIEQDIIYDPKKIELLTEKLDALYRLQKKHSIQSVEDLIKLRDELSEKLFNISNLEEQISKAGKEVEAIKESLLKQANELSAKRKSSFAGIENEILGLLKQLGMENSRIKIVHLPLDDFDNMGLDKVRFMFNANKGGDLKDLNKVASGGELSRLMLSIKYLVSKNTDLPTIIFDEIDTGVSGDVADKMGSIMKQMSKKMQVLTITHLPQIACKGHEHWFVYKDHGKDQTVSHIRKLNKDERIVEIAKMLSNNKPTDAAIKNAEELLGN